MKRRKGKEVCYIGGMGRGQATAVADQFSHVFGTKRGSQVAQALRDRYEMRDKAHAHLNRSWSPDMRLTPGNLEEFHEELMSSDPVVQEEIREALLHNMHSDGLQAVAKTLSFPTVTELPPGVDDLLRELVEEHVKFMTKADAFSVDLDEVEELTKRTFSYAESPFPLDIARKYQGIIGAVSGFYQSIELPGYAVAVLSSIGSQPDSHLELYQPLLDVVMEEIKTEHSEDFLSGIARTLSGVEQGASPTKIDFFSGLRSTLEKLKTLSPLEMAVLTHPAWDEKEYVTKENVASRSKDGRLMDGGRSAQRTLRVLNGGTSGAGIQYTHWHPQAIPGKRFAYSLSDLGRRVRAEQAGQ